MDVAEVEGVHGVGSDTVDVVVGEMQDLVVIEDDYGGVLHDEGVHLAIELEAFVGIGLF